MQLKKVAAWAAVVFLAWYLFTQPAATGNALNNLLHLLQQTGASIATFLGGAR